MAGATGDPFDFHAPLGFEGSGADHENPCNIRFPRQEFGYADPLDGFAQSHVVCQDGPARPDSKGDAIQLIRQKGDSQEGATQGMIFRIAPDGGDFCRKTLPVQGLLNKLFGVRVDPDGAFQTFHRLNAPEKVGKIRNRPPLKGGNDLLYSWRQPSGIKKAKGPFLPYCTQRMISLGR
jgi:hypothetical protein